MLREGTNSLTMISFMCGTAEVATAKSVGSMGELAIDDGEKAIQALE